MSKARGLADLGNAYDDGALSNRNLIINGAMQVAQRGTSHSVSGNNRSYTLDRVAYYGTGTPSAAFTFSQDTDAPDSFGSSLKVATTTADTTPTGLVKIRYEIEAQDLQHLKFGSSAASQVSFSFWVKSTQTGTAAIMFYQPDGGLSVVLNYTINATNTWEYKTLVVPAQTTSAIANDNTSGMHVQMCLMADTATYGVAAQSSWASYVSANRAHGQTLNVANSTSDTFQITGVQLEVGDTATPFEHRSYGDELQSCQRYYFEARKGSYPEAYHYYARSNTAVVGNVPFPVTMRATPSVTLNSNGVDNRAVRVDTAALVTFSPAQSWWTKDAMAGLYTSVNTPFVSGESYGIGIKADAEL